MCDSPLPVVADCYVVDIQPRSFACPHQLCMAAIQLSVHENGMRALALLAVSLGHCYVVHLRSLNPSSPYCPWMVAIYMGFMATMALVAAWWVQTDETSPTHLFLLAMNIVFFIQVLLVLSKAATTAPSTPPSFV